MIKGDALLMRKTTEIEDMYEQFSEKSGIFAI